MGPGQKNVPLEGIRGLAAISVLVWHLYLGFLPGTVVVDKLWFGLLNGPAAVTLFFVLSAYVLTRRYLVTGDNELIEKAALKRWPRLAGPVVLVTLLSWLLFRLDGYHYFEAGRQIGSPFLQTFAYSLKGDAAASGPPAIGLAEILHVGAYRTFFEGHATYDQVLWTMRIELLGSFVAFALALLLGPNVRGRWAVKALVCAVAIVACRSFGAAYVAFPVGVALAWLLPRQPGPMTFNITMLTLVTSIFLLGHSGVAAGPFAPLRALLPATYIHVAAAVLLIWTAEASPSFKRWMSGRFSARIGELSFPLYLVHVPVQCSLGCLIYLSAAPVLGTTGATAAAVLATIAGSFALALPVAAFNARWVEFVNRGTSYVWSAAPTGLRLPRPDEAQLDLPLRTPR